MRTYAFLDDIEDIAACDLPCCARRPFAVFDLETTGLEPGIDEILEIAIVLVDEDGNVESEWDTLVAPSGEVGASWIHGITSEMVTDAPVFNDVMGDVADLLAGRVLVAHNAYFDVRFLAAEMRRCGDADFPRLPVVCTMHSSKVLGYGGFISLDSLCTSFAIDTGRAHRALDDARATAELLRIELDTARTSRGHLHRWGDPTLPTLAPGYGPHLGRTGQRLSR